MAAGRHKKQTPPTPSRALFRLAAPATALTVLAAAAVAVMGPDVSTEDAAASVARGTAGSAAASIGRVLPDPSRTPAVSRSERRAPLNAASVAPTPARPPVPAVRGHRFAATALNVRSGPGEDTRLLTVLAAGARVGVTGTVRGPWAQIVHRDRARWVHAAYLAETRPTPRPSPAVANSPSTDDGPADAPCPTGSSVESGLTPDAVRVHRAVCARFPQVAGYGGVRGDSADHASGRALDVMVSSSSSGDSIADWVRANAGALGVSEVLWSQRIWTVQRSGDGWRAMEDRGSSTANHYDHVHVTVYGDGGG